jgi:hypothetical protein
MSLSARAPWLVPLIWRGRRVFGQAALFLGAPRRSRRRAPQRPSTGRSTFEIYTFVTDDSLYDRMRQSFIDSGFDSGGFVRLADSSDDPYTAITRIGREAPVRYPILCHQDVLAGPAAGALDLIASLEELNAIDPYWVVAGTVGVMRSGRVLMRFADGSTGETLPLPVATLDENFLVLNARNSPRCSRGLAGFHLYGSDVCLNALLSGGSAYVIDFPVTHLSRGHPDSTAYDTAKQRFVETWSRICLFCYVPTSIETLFVSRSRLLRRVFCSPRAMTSVEDCRKMQPSSHLRRIDVLSAIWSR